MAHIITSYRPWFVAKLTKYIGTVLSDTDTVAAGSDGLSAGTIQEALQDLATRVQALEDV